MRRILLALLLLALSVPASAEDRLAWGGSMMVVGGGTPAAGGAPSYLYQENFEGTGYDSALGNMAESGSVINEDYATSPAPLEGSQSILLDSGSSFATATGPSFSAGTSPVYGYMMWSPVTLPVSGEVTPFEIISGSTVVASIRINFSTTPKWKMVVGSTASALGPTVVAGTTYHVWWDYTAGSGADATANLYISETTTKPSVTCAASGGSATLSATKVKFISFLNTSDHIFDKIRVDDSDIGSSPQ